VYGSDALDRVSYFRLQQYAKNKGILSMFNDENQVVDVMKKQCPTARIRVFIQAGVVDIIWHGDQCPHCENEIVHPKPCHLCYNTTYCSGKCREANSSKHKKDCYDLYLQTMLLSSLVSTTSKLKKDMIITEDAKFTNNIRDVFPNPQLMWGYPTHN